MPATREENDHQSHPAVKTLQATAVICLHNTPTGAVVSQMLWVYLIPFLLDSKSPSG